MNIPPPSLFCLLKWEEIFLLKDSKYHKLSLWPHNDSCIVTSRSNDIIRKQNIDFFYLCDEEKQFHCVFPIKNKKNSLLALIFKQITPNLEESVCSS